MQVCGPRAVLALPCMGQASSTVQGKAAHLDFVHLEVGNQNVLRAQGLRVGNTKNQFTAQECVLQAMLGSHML